MVMSMENSKYNQNTSYSIHYLKLIWKHENDRFQQESGLPGVQKSGNVHLSYIQKSLIHRFLERRSREVQHSFPPLAAIAETKQRPIKGPSGTPRSGPSDRGGKWGGGWFDGRILEDSY